MNILVLQETDWLTRGPHIQHHLFERLSRNPSINITVIDYDIDNVQRTKSILQKKRKFHNINRTIKNSNVKIIRTAHINIPYLRRFSTLITNFFEILKIIRKNRPDIIIGYSISNGFIGLLLAKFFHIPYIFHYIDTLHKLVPITYAQDIARIISRFLLKHSNLMIVFNKYQQSNTINEGTSPEKIKILPTGISLKNSSFNENKLQKLKYKFSITEDDFVIFFMGWLYEFAGLKEIIDFYNYDVRNGRFKLKFLILGDGGIYESLIKHVKEIGAEWVLLPGRVPFFEIREYIQLANLCLLSFKINDITKAITPIKIIEYLAMKKPVLSTRLPGVVYELGINKGVIFTRDQNDLIRKIGDLIPHKEKLKKIGLEGFENIKDKFEWTKIINQFKEIVIESIKLKEI